MSSLAAVVLLTVSCSAQAEPASKTANFEAAGSSCVGSWRLENVSAAGPEEALEVAETALAEAEPSAADLAEASSLLDLSMTNDERANASEVEFASEAHMLAVTTMVKDALEAHGYPDDERVVEIWSEHRCD